LRGFVASATEEDWKAPTIVQRREVLARFGIKGRGTNEPAKQIAVLLKSKELIKVRKKKRRKGKGAEGRKKERM
jgi:hypothetical protein